MSARLLSINRYHQLLWEQFPQCVLILAVNFRHQLKVICYWLSHQSRGCYQPIGNRHVGDNVTLSRDDHAQAQIFPIVCKHTGTFSLVGKFPTGALNIPTWFSVGKLPMCGNWGIYQSVVIGKRTYCRNNTVVIISVKFSYDFSQCVLALNLINQCLNRK